MMYIHIHICAGGVVLLGVLCVMTSVFCGVCLEVYLYIVYVMEYGNRWVLMFFFLLFVLGGWCAYGCYFSVCMLL